MISFLKKKKIWIPSSIIIAFLFWFFLLKKESDNIIYVDVEISDQQKIKNIFELKKILEPLCENFIDFGCYKSDNVNLD